MTDARPPPMDAPRWARLKDHLADLSVMEERDREAALGVLPLDATDRQHLEQLLAPLRAGDARLLAPHPSTRAADHASALRCSAGDIVGRYRVEGLLGRGGMGEVYEARCLDSEQLVALKVLRSGLTQSDYARFSENEQRALRRLDDPRIAKFIEAFTLPEIGTCLVLEWVDGEQLQSYCRSRRFNVEARLKLFIEVCHAVASAHQQLVVHRDLKPSNVLVTPDGQVKLLDFGVAKLLDEVSALTQTHDDLFSLDYAAPEQVLRESVATTTDVYALGVLLFRLLTDVSPYPLQDGGSLVKAVLNDAPQRLAEALDRSRTTGGSPPALQLDRDLDRVVQHAMEKEPRNRYRGAIELAADVQAVLDGLPISGGGGATYRLRKFVRRHRTMAAATVVVMLSLIAATGFSLQAARRAQLQAHRADVANDFLLATLDLGDQFSSANQGDSTLSEVLVRAVTAAHTQLRDEPQVRANVLNQLSIALRHRGMSAAALTAAREAYDIRATNRDDEPAAFAASAQVLASAEIETGHMDDAALHLDESVEHLAATPAHAPMLIAAYTSMGKLASARGDAGASLRLYQQIIPLRQSLPGDQVINLAMDYNNLGTGLNSLGRLQEADAAYSLGIELLHQRLGAEHPRLAFIEYGRSVTLMQLGRFDEARTIIKRVEASLGAADKSPGGVPGTVSPERILAQLDFLASNYSGARQRLVGAIAQMRPAGPVSFSLGLTLVLRGRVELATGDARAALTTFIEADRIMVESGYDKNRQRWYALGMLGVARAAIGDVEQGDVEQGDVEQGDVEQSDVEQSDVEQGDVEQSDVEQSDVEQSDVEQSDVEQGDVEQSDVEQSDVEQSDVEQSDVEQSDVEQSDVEQSDVEQSDVEQGDVEQGDAELADALAHLLDDSAHNSGECAELLLYAGAAAET